MTLAGRGTRVPFALLSGLLAVLLATQPSLAAVRWTAPVKASPSLAYNHGMGLARTVSSATGTPYLHQQYTYAGTTYPGVYYRRGNATLSAWGTQRRVSPSGAYADDGAIAASSKYVHVAYRTVGSWTHPDPAAARAIGVRTNTNHGSSTAWLGGKTVSTVARAGRPAIAAYGSWAWIVYTDAGTGAILLARNNGTNTSGSTWTTREIGRTTAGEGSAAGYEGYPVVAAYGASVLVSWIAAPGGGIVSKRSTDRGATWPATMTTLRSGRVSDLSAAAASGRFAIAWADATGIRARLFRSGAWQAAKTIASFSATGTWRNGYGTAIALAGTSRVGVAWSACSRADCLATASGSKGVSVRWRESTDNLASQKASVTIASYGASSTRRYSDMPSAVFVSTPKRYVLYNVASADYETSFATLGEVGTGAP